MHNLRTITGIHSNKVRLRVSLTMGSTTEIQIKKINLKKKLSFCVYLMPNENVPVK